MAVKIVLVGYMGSGKSTVGRQLAADLDFNFVDLDAYIEASLKMKITQIFAEKGELFFRKEEHRLLKELLQSEDNLVLSTGGGAPCYSGNMDTMLVLTNFVFYLKVSIPELVARLSKEKEHRPLIRHLEEGDLPEFIGKHLFERNIFYQKAIYTISCDQKAVRTIVEEIKGFLI